MALDLKSERGIELALELARKAQVDLEMDPRISGGVIMTATDRPFTRTSSFPPGSTAAYRTFRPYVPACGERTV